MKRLIEICTTFFAAAMIIYGTLQLAPKFVWYVGAVLIVLAEKILTDDRI